jgi:hypothetical protein
MTFNQQGEFLNNNLGGHGVFRWNDGKHYEGNWLMSQMHG